MFRYRRYLIVLLCYEVRECWIVKYCSFSKNCFQPYNNALQQYELIPNYYKTSTIIKSIHVLCGYQILNHSITKAINSFFYDNKRSIQSKQEHVLHKTVINPKSYWDYVWRLDQITIIFGVTIVIALGLGLVTPTLNVLHRVLRPV